MKVHLPYVIASAELYQIFSKFWWNEALHAWSFMMSSCSRWDLRKVLQIGTSGGLSNICIPSHTGISSFQHTIIKSTEVVCKYTFFRLIFMFRVSRLILFLFLIFFIKRKCAESLPNLRMQILMNTLTLVRIYILNCFWYVIWNEVDWKNHLFWNGVLAHFGLKKRHLIMMKFTCVIAYLLLKNQKLVQALTNFINFSSFIFKA